MSGSARYRCIMAWLRPQLTLCEQKEPMVYAQKVRRTNGSRRRLPERWIRCNR